MSIFVNGKNIEMYTGDTGYIHFYGIPYNRYYDMYLSVSNAKRNILFELKETSYVVGIDATTKEVKMEINEGETLSAFITRVQAAGYTPQGRVLFFISDDESDKLKVASSSTSTTYNYGLKMCYTNGSNYHEDTLLPPTTTTTSGKVVFKDPVTWIVHPKYVNGY